MIAADVVRLASQGLLAGLLVGGVARLWEIVVLVTIGGAATAFFNPAVTGLVAQVVSPGRLQQADALRSVSASLGGVLGPAVAGALVATAAAAAPRRARADDRRRPAARPPRAARPRPRDCGRRPPRRRVAHAPEHPLGDDDPGAGSGAVPVAHHGLRPLHLRRRVPTGTRA